MEPPPRIDTAPEALGPRGGGAAMSPAFEPPVTPMATPRAMTHEGPLPYGKPYDTIKVNMPVSAPSMVHHMAQILYQKVRRIRSSLWAPSSALIGQVGMRTWRRPSSRPNVRRIPRPGRSLSRPGPSATTSPRCAPALSSPDLTFKHIFLSTSRYNTGPFTSAR